MITRCLFFIIPFVLVFSTLSAQLAPPPKPNRKPGKNTGAIHGRAGLALGSHLVRYPYPLTDISCRLVIFKGKFLFDTRLRAYGIKSIVNGRNYDLTAYIHKVRAWTNNLTFYYGAGAELMLRSNGDDRSQATSGVLPMIMGGSMYYKKKIYVNVPMWAKFYGNGFSLTVLPEPSYKITDDVMLFLRYELGILVLYNGSSHEWRHDAMVGAYYSF